MLSEPVVLVTQANEPVGLMEKAEVHTSDTPLHRGFSIFLFRHDGSTLLQRRSVAKKTFPGLWSNACCGHPLPDESPTQAASRRLLHELGINLGPGEMVMVDPDYTYRAERAGIVEYEICPIIVARYDGEVTINPGEVAEIRWQDWGSFLEEARHTSDIYTPWAIEEAELIAPRLHQLLTF